MAHRRCEAVFIKKTNGTADDRTVVQHPASIRPRSAPVQVRRSAVAFILILVVVAVVVLAAVMVLMSDTASGGDIASEAIRLSVTLFIPALVMIAYWLIVQRQVRTAKSDLQIRLDSGQDLIARVSHQLRDQLTVIYGFSEALLDSDMSDQTEVRDVVTIINAEAVDLSRVVDDLVSAAELDAGEFDVSVSRFDPAVEVERVVLPFRRRGFDISVECWSGVAVSDPVRFRQIIRTLLSNATAHGGPTVGFVGELSNGSFLCTVVDDGEGMSAAFEGQFFGSSTVPETPTGEIDASGLGLEVSQAIAQQLGGRLTYERSSDLTMVTMVLPTKGWPNLPPTVDGSADIEEPSAESEGSDIEESNDDDTENAAEPETESDEEATEEDDPTPEDNWLISFDTKDDPESDSVDTDSDDLAEEAEAVAEAPASS
jgi:signal transduction histidine kinase